MSGRAAGRLRRWLGLFGLFLAGFPLAVLALAEYQVRSTGLGDRPLYHADAIIGYIPRPSQQGKFKNALEWAFNERSMRTAKPFWPDDKARDILLIGDSLVFGGHDNLSAPGPVLARMTGARVWPIAAPSWGLANELTYLEDNPDVTERVDDIIFVVNSEDFGPASYWVNEYMHPTRRPRSYAAYWLGSQFLMGWNGGAIPVVDRGPLAARLARLRGRTKARFLFLYYPSLDELAGKHGCFEAPEFTKAYPGYCLGQDQEWSPTIYADHIHPRDEANPLLGRAMARALEAVADKRLRGSSRANAAAQR